MLSEVINLIGGILEENEITETNPAFSAVDFENEVFRFYLDEDGISHFEHKESDTHATWYIWIHRGFEHNKEYVSATDALDILDDCLMSLEKYDKKIVWDDVILDWVVLDDPEEEG